MNRALAHFLTDRDPHAGQKRTQTLVVAAVFLLAVVLAWRAAAAGDVAAILEDKLILLIPLAAGALLLLRFPQVGLIALVPTALTITFQVSTGTVTRLNAAILLIAALLAIWVFNVIALRQRLPLIRSRTILPLLLFCAVAVLAFAVGQMPWFGFAARASLPAQLGGLALFFLCAGAYLLVGALAKTLRILEWMTWLFLGIGGAFVAASLLGLTGLAENIVYHRLISHSLFWMWLAALSFSQAMFNHSLSRPVRLALWALLAGLLLIRLVRDSGWTSGWLPALAALGVILFAGGSKWVWLSVPAVLLGGLWKFDAIRGLLLTGDNEYSLVTRLEAWRILAEIIRASPFLGLGPANYYWYTPLYPILGYSVQFNSHNNYVDLVAQVGLIGLVMFAWFAWRLWQTGWALRSQALPGFERAYVIGALGGLAGTLLAGMLGDWFLPFIYNIGFAGSRASLLGWAFLGGLLAIEQIVRRRAGEG